MQKDEYEPIYLNDSYGDIMELEYSDENPSMGDFEMLCTFVKTYHDFDKLELVPTTNSENGWKYIMEFIDKLENTKSLEKKTKLLYEWVSDFDSHDDFTNTVGVR